MSRKIFTVSEADGLIPALVDVFREIGAHKRNIRELAGKLEVLELLWGTALRDGNHPDHPESMAHREGIDRALRGIQTAVERGILDRGMRFPAGGIEEGLVDFPTTYQARWVLLCWKLGERHLEYWHELDGGFRGRHKLTEAQRLVMGTDDPDSLEDPGLDL
ncbi:MAG TPA: DUF2203 family protein [Candidatus Krumholzibacteria bacterium]|nr:DUF2203 family protein [Candidatus Krumholzibacteria bacterium]